MRLGGLLRAKYNQLSLSDYIELDAYLSDKKKHLAQTKQAREKLRSRALTYMESAMDSKKNGLLPENFMEDIAKNGKKFIETFGYDADGAFNPVARKFQNWMENRANRMPAEKTAAPGKNVVPEKTVEPEKTDVPARNTQSAKQTSTRKLDNLYRYFTASFGCAGLGAFAGGLGGMLTGVGTTALAATAVGAACGLAVIPTVVVVQKTASWIAKKVKDRIQQAKQKREHPKAQVKVLPRAKEAKARKLDNLYSYFTASLGCAGLGAFAGGLGGMLTGVGTTALAATAIGATCGLAVIPAAVAVKKAVSLMRGKEKVHIEAPHAQTFEMRREVLNEKLHGQEQEVAQPSKPKIVEMNRSNRGNCGRSA